MTQADSPAPPLPSLKPPSLRRWLVLWTLVAAALIALLSFNARLDTFLWCSTRWAVGDNQHYTWAAFHTAHAADPAPAFYMVMPPPMDSRFLQRTAWFWARCKSGGDVWAVVLAIAAIAIFHRRQRRLLAGTAAGGVVLSALLTALIAILDGRFRPTHTDGANRWELFRGFHNTTDLAFPSSHATVAFAATAGLSYAFPRLRFLFIPLASLTAISRVVHQAHFWSDVLLGSALGWTLTYLLMHAADQFLTRISTRKS